jgi:two-component system, NtrC family, sensor histidine kinase GlrK
MPLHYPKSFTRLLLAAFACVVVPLIAALVTNALSMDRLVDGGEHAVRVGVELTRHSRALGEMVDSLERKARQMIVLEDRTLSDDYATSRSQFRQRVELLSAMPLSQERRVGLDAIVMQEQRVFELVDRHPLAPPMARAVAEEFERLAVLTTGFSGQVNDHIEAEIETLYALAQRTQRLIAWQLLAIIPLILLLTAGSMRLLGRPIRQLDHAIRRLGDGDLAAAVEVRGPADMVLLGQRLDWLRVRLLEVEAQKGRFLQHVSHELKTPLTAMWEGAALLVEEVVGHLNARQREIVRILQKSSDQLRRLIEDLLNYTAAESLSTRGELKAVRLCRVIGSVTETHGLAMAAKGVSIRVDCADVAVPGDEEKLRIVVDNLLSNAIKYSPPGEAIDIRVRRAGDSAVLDIADTGPGIPEQECSRVFDPFYQGPQAISSAIRGSGLGLSIVREHVLAHNGRVEILEFAPKGAHLRIVLPIYEEEEVA